MHELVLLVLLLVFYPVILLTMTVQICVKLIILFWDLCPRISQWRHNGEVNRLNFEEWSILENWYVVDQVESRIQRSGECKMGLYPRTIYDFKPFSKSYASTYAYSSWSSSFATWSEFASSYGKPGVDNEISAVLYPLRTKARPCTHSWLEIICFPFIYVSW